MSMRSLAFVAVLALLAFEASAAPTSGFYCYAPPTDVAGSKRFPLSLTLRAEPDDFGVPQTYTVGVFLPLFGSCVLQGTYKALPNSSSTGTLLEFTATQLNTCGSEYQSVKGMYRSSLKDIKLTLPVDSPEGASITVGKHPSSCPSHALYGARRSQNYCAVVHDTAASLWFGTPATTAKNSASISNTVSLSILGNRSFDKALCFIDAVFWVPSEPDAGIKFVPIYSDCPSDIQILEVSFNATTDDFSFWVYVSGAVVEVTANNANCADGMLPILNTHGGLPVTFMGAGSIPGSNLSFTAHDTRFNFTVSLSNQTGASSCFAVGQYWYNSTSANSSLTNNVNFISRSGTCPYAFQVGEVGYVDARPNAAVVLKGKYDNTPWAATLNLAQHRRRGYY